MNTHVTEPIKKHFLALCCNTPRQIVVKINCLSAQKKYIAALSYFSPMQENTESRDTGEWVIMVLTRHSCQATT